MSSREATADIKLVLEATIVNALPDGQEPSAGLGLTVATKFDSGTSENQYNREWEDKRTLLSGASEDLDFFDFTGFDIGAGAGKDALGQDLRLQEIVTLIIQQTGGDGKLEINATDPTGMLLWVRRFTVANGAATGKTLLFMHSPGEIGYPVIEGSSFEVRVSANGGDVEYTVVVLGRDTEEESTSSRSSSSSSVSSISSSSTSSRSSSSTSSASSSSVSSSSTSSVSSSSSSSS